MMRSKKIIKILIILIISIPVIYFGIFFIQNYSLKNSFAKEENTKFDEDTKFIRCNYNILNPEFAFTFGTGEGGRIGFYRPKNTFYQTEQEWDDNDIGGTTITNTTFPELVSMVKEDCSQFQEDYDNPLVDEGGIDWGYREAEPPEPPKTDGEIVEEEMEEMYNKIRSVLSFVNESLTNLQRDKFTEFYGDIDEMNYEEIYQIYLQLMVSGQMMVDESLHEYFYNEYGLKDMEYE